MDSQEFTLWVADHMLSAEEEAEAHAEMSAQQEPAKTDPRFETFNA